MTIISSQHYLNADIVDAKVEALRASGVSSITVPCVYVGEINGTEYALQSDAHHTLAAARILGLPVEFNVNDDPEGLTGEALLTIRYMDGDYYNVETSDPLADDFDLIW